MMQEDDVGEVPLVVRLDVAAVEHCAGEICYRIKLGRYKTTQAQAAAGYQAVGKQKNKCYYYQQTGGANDICKTGSGDG